MRQPSLFPGALGHRALSWSHTQSWPEPAAGSISKQATRIPGFAPTACPAPCSQAAPWNTCCTAFPRHEGCLWLLSRSYLLPENRNFPEAAVPSTLLLLIINLSPKGSEDVQSLLLVVIGKQTSGDPRLARINYHITSMVIKQLLKLLQKSNL